jgi:hypothetical protein
MLRFLSTVLSVVFHPFLILSYMLLILLLVNPFLFGYRSIREADSLFLVVFLTSFLIPAITVLLLKFLGWIKTMRMPTREERIGPFIVTAVIYLSLYLHLVRAGGFPKAFVVFTLGLLIAIFVGFFMNLFTKISLHAIGMGALASMVILTWMFFSYDSFQLVLTGSGSYKIQTKLLIYIFILLGGLVCSARLMLKAHKVFEIYTGYLVGFFTQLVAFIILQ